MIDRDTVLATLAKAYEFRIAGDKEGVASLCAPNATFQIAGDAALMRPAPVGPGDAATTIAALIDNFVFHDRREITALVEGNKAVILAEFVLSRPGGKPVTTTALDLWEVDDNGAIVSGLQFVDTALLAKLVGEEEIG